MSDDDDDWMSSRPDPETQRQQEAAPRRAAEPQRQQEAGPPPPRLMMRPKGADETVKEVQAPVVKTMKQKEAEYAAARARIFGQQNGGRGRGNAAVVSSAPASNGGRGRGYGGRGGQQQQQQRQQGYSGGGGGGRRQRDDDDDPDYCRNPELYAARLAPPDEPYVSSGSRYIPPTYEAEFPSLG